MAPHPNSIQFVAGLGLLSLMIGTWIWAFTRAHSGRALLPAPSTRVVPWGGWAVALVMAIWVLIQIKVPPALLDLAGIEIPKEPRVPLGPAVSIPILMISNVIFVVAALAIVWQTSGATLADFLGERGRMGQDIARGLVAWPLLAPIVFGVSAVTLTIWQRVEHPVEVWIKSRPGAGILMLAAASAVIIAPICEEFLFRGILLGWLDRVALKDFLRKQTPSPQAPDFEPEPGGVPQPRTPASLTLGLHLFLTNATVSLVFASLHAGVWPSPVPLFLLSLGLGTLYQRTGSLIAPITLHATFNGVSTLFLLLGVFSAPPA